MQELRIVGLMSGTSLDGLDAADCIFRKDEQGKWTYELLWCETVKFTEDLVKRLENVSSAHAPSLALLDYDLAVFYSDCVNDLLVAHKVDKTKIDAIASHGQTVFHQPAKGYTTQIGNPAVLAVKTGIPVIGDFRTKDILYGGQGAPLVPIGDKYLFDELADAFLNIGGFTNISFTKNGVTRAFDISPGNLPLNKLARNRGLEYDRNGDLAASGEINYFLLDLLNQLPYYSSEGPKSLGTEWLEQEFYPMLKFDNNIENNLATVTEHIAYQLAEVLKREELASVLISGGGARNLHLMNRLAHYYKGNILFPDKQLSDFKEAIIFGFLGALHLCGEPTNIPSVTGASKAICSGVLHKP